MTPPPYDRLETMADWVAGLGYRGIQIPSWDGRVFDLETAATSKTYCDDYRGKLCNKGLQPTELDQA